MTRLAEIAARSAKSTEFHWAGPNATDFVPATTVWTGDTTVETAVLADTEDEDAEHKAEATATEYVPPKFEAYVAGQPQFFATEAEAVEYVEQHESGEVRRIWDDVQVYVKFPRPTWV